MLDVLRRGVIFYTTSSKIYHLYPENLSNLRFCDMWYVRVPPVVKGKLLFPWLLLQIYWNYSSCTI
ncbi:hypothetical protein BVRB_4g083730 [Beta vulgaris subsp. vulgaris]|nr:hypothetical protein BVRB_4g083730 [Beta vulgaris subsp. vulgaris]